MENETPGTMTEFYMELDLPLYEDTDEATHCDCNKCHGGT